VTGMNRLVCVAAVAVLLTGCGHRSSTTPKQTFDVFRQALVDEDFDTVWGMLSSATRDDAERLAARAREAPEVDRLAIAGRLGLTPEAMADMDGKAFFLAGTKAAIRNRDPLWTRVLRAEFLRAEIDGDRARVYTTIDGDPESDPLPLTLEDGRWHVNLAGG